MKHSPVKEGPKGPRSSAEIAAEMSALGAMLPGSIRKTFRTYHTKKRGDVRAEAQPIYTTWDPVKKRQVSRHVPKACFEEIRAMTLNYARYRELQKEFDAALVRENMPVGGRVSKKKTLLPRCAHAAKVMAQFVAGEFPLGELDARIKEAVQADGRDTLAQAYAAEAEARSGKGRRRTASTVTALGRVKFAYRYSAGRGADKVLPELTGGEKSPLRATDAARSLIAETAARLDSVAEGCAFLAKTTDVEVSVASALKVVRHAGAKTRALWRGGHFRSAADRAVARLAQLEEDGRIALLEDKGIVKKDGRSRLHYPKGSRYVGLTVAFSGDGVGAPCTHADTAGVKGKNGEEAGTRECKLLTATFYDRVDKNGHPIVNKGCIVHYSSTKPADEFISEVNALVNSMGYTRIQRVQFISDGAAWLENLARQVFTDGKVLRVIDFYHACEYLGLVVKELSGDATWKEDFAKLKKLMKEKGGRAALAELERMFGASSVAGIGGDAAKALAYIRNRLQYMEYGAYRADGYYIGSGTVESACKSVVAARCKLAGMHWRLATVDAITLLRATLRSRLAIAA